MSYWSVYVSKEDAKALEKELDKIAKKNRWSFSQAVTGVLREHLIDEKRKATQDLFEQMTTQSFFEGYPESDSIYDKL